MSGWSLERWARFRLAVQFLTRLPVGSPDWSPERAIATPRWYPAVGVLVGAIAALVWWLAALVFPPALAAILSTVAGILVTGALHEDGFADCCDGLGGAADKARVLEIMKDSRIGAYGVLGMVSVLAVKVAALAALPAAAVPAVLVAGHALSRASAVVVIATSDYVRDEGTGRSVAGAGGGMGLVAAVSLLALLPLGFGAGMPVAVAGLAGAAIGHLAMRRIFERRLGGYTGDCLGATQQISEAGFFVAIVAVIGTVAN